MNRPGIGDAPAIRSEINIKQSSIKEDPLNKKGLQYVSTDSGTGSTFNMDNKVARVKCVRILLALLQYRATFY